MEKSINIRESVEKDRMITKLLGETENSILKYPFDRISKEDWEKYLEYETTITPNTDDGARYFEERNLLKMYLWNAIRLLRRIEDSLNDAKPVHPGYTTAIEALVNKRAKPWMLKKVDDVLKEFGFKTYEVPAEIDGVPCSLNECQVRALQIIAKRSTQVFGGFEEFCKQVKISSMKKEDPTMVFREDGCFANEFAKGFFDVNKNLLFEIL